MFIARYKHIVSMGRRVASRLIAIAIAMSFLAMLLPIASASVDKANTMACCAGKTAGHCDSELAAEKVPEPEPEPMCGLSTGHAEDDGITIVAKPAENRPHHAAETSPSQPAFETVSVSQPCQMECSACAATSGRQQKRERGVVQPISAHTSLLATHSRFEELPFSFSSNEDWEQTSPRGPPISLL